MISQSVPNSVNLYNGFSKVDYSSNKQFLTNAYAPRHEVQYYNDPKEIKKQKHKKIRKILTLSFIGASLLSLASVFGIQAARGKINVKELGDAVANNKATKKTINALVNFSNVKDDYWTRFSKWLKSKKIGFVDSANEKLADVYRKLSKNKYQKTFDDALAEVHKLKGKANIEGLPENFEKWYSKLDSAIQEGIYKDGRITDGLITKKTFSKKGLSEFAHKMTDGIMSEDKLATVRAKYLKQIEIPENASEELKAAIDKFNKIKLENGAEVFERLRDTNLGNAGTDALGIVASLGLLGGSVAASDTKEERKSTVINLGIPLLTTLASAIYGTAKCMSGGKALLFGFATGQVASIVAGTIDKFVTKHAQKQNLKAQNQNLDKQA